MQTVSQPAQMCYDRWVWKQIFSPFVSEEMTFVICCLFIFHTYFYLNTFLDIFDQQCCQIDCYTLRDCKLATSSHCTTTPVECAMGDAYRYTIQPVFQNLKKDFQCHVKHKKPNALYTMFFHIKVRRLSTYFQQQDQFTHTDI